MSSWRGGGARPGGGGSGAGCGEGGAGALWREARGLPGGGAGCLGRVGLDRRGARRRASAGDIVISHMNQPDAGTGAGYRAAVPAMLAEGTVFLTLSDALAAS